MFAFCAVIKAEEVSVTNTETQVVLVYIDGSWIVVYHNGKDIDENDVDF